MRMARFFSVIALGGALVGCGGPHVDNTMNRGMNPALNYPKAPYGYAKGSIIAPLTFVGKEDPNGAAGTALYADLQTQTFDFAAIHNDKTIGYLLLSGSAGWCVPCREEAAEIRRISPMWEPKGVKFVTVLIQGFDEANQTPSTVPDIDRWQALLKEHIGIAIDPSDNLHEFADQIASFPLNILVRTYDMAILTQSIGLDPNSPSPINDELSTYVQ
jgi:hypothetical protein